MTHTVNQIIIIAQKLYVDNKYYIQVQINPATHTTKTACIIILDAHINLIFIFRHKVYYIFSFSFLQLIMPQKL